MRATRRQVITGALAVAGAAVGTWGRRAPDFADLEARYGARLGIAAVELGGRGGVRVLWRPDERFAFCSTYKALAGASVLRRNLPLDRVIHYSAADLVAYSPVTSQHVADGMTIGAIAEAAIRQSDNTAGNLLFRVLGGPAGLERVLRGIGDRTTIASRIEPELNSAVPGDPRDTSTPRALAGDLAAIADGHVLDRADRMRLLAWMSGNATGDALIRAGLPAGWTVADKSGAGSYGTRNDIGVVTPPSGPGVALAVLSTRPGADDTYDDALIASAASRVIAAWPR